jgi:hypothetical protein
LNAAVNVVRSVASKEAKSANPESSCRLINISKMNWPFVRPSGRNSVSKRRVSARAAR